MLKVQVFVLWAQAEYLWALKHFHLVYHVFSFVYYHPPS